MLLFVNYKSNKMFCFKLRSLAFMKTGTFSTTHIQYPSAQKQRELNKMDYLEQFSRFYLCSFIVRKIILAFFSD